MRFLRQWEIRLSPHRRDIRLRLDWRESQLSLGRCEIWLGNLARRRCGWCLLRKAWCRWDCCLHWLCRHGGRTWWRGPLECQISSPWKRDIRDRKGLIPPQLDYPHISQSNPMQTVGPTPSFRVENRHSQSRRIFLPQPEPPYPIRRPFIDLRSGWRQPRSCKTRWRRKSRVSRGSEKRCEKTITRRLESFRR